MNKLEQALRLLEEVINDIHEEEEEASYEHYEAHAALALLTLTERKKQTLH